MHTTALDDAFFSGAADLERTDRGMRPHRLPRWVREQFPDPQLLGAEVQPSGVVIAFRTAATRIELLVHPTARTYRGIERPRGRVGLRTNGTDVASVVLSHGDVVETDLLAGQTVVTAGQPDRVVFSGLPGILGDVELVLPHNESVEIVELLTDAPIEPLRDDRPVWVHHGSSISQGSNATDPAQTWPALAARDSGVRLRNLGFGGSALIDPFMARVIRDAPADVISLELGINVVNLDAMRLRALVPALHGFLDTIRDGQPRTPLLLVSPFHCAIHETTPGPLSMDPSALAAGRVRFVATGADGDTRLGRLTLQVVREAVAEVASRRDDEHLHHLDGLGLFGQQDEGDLPLADGLHPGPEAHRLIGGRFGGLLRDHLRG